MRSDLRPETAESRSHGTELEQETAKTNKAEDAARPIDAKTIRIWWRIGKRLRR